MNSVKLTKGELTKIILEEVRNLQEEDAIVDQANEMLEGYKQEIVNFIQALNPQNKDENDMILSLHRTLFRQGKKQ